MLDWMKRSRAKNRIADHYTPTNDKVRYRFALEPCPESWKKEVDLPYAAFVYSWVTYSGMYYRAYLDKNYVELLIQFQDMGLAHPPPLKTYWRAWTP